MKRKRNKKRNRDRRRRDRGASVPVAAPAFGVGSRVRVKPGTTDPDFTDMPLGGWAGTVREIQPGSNPPTYLVEWNQDTLDQMPAIYRTRCARDDLSVETVWMTEPDLEPDNGGPVVIEQPTHTVSRPLSVRDPDDRVRAVFGLISDDPLPEADLKNLSAYGRYMAANLSFPFRVKQSIETGTFQYHKRVLTVVGLVDADECDEGEGLLCRVEEGGEAFEVPLADLEVRHNPRHRQLVEDYSYWFFNFPPADQQWSADLPSQWADGTDLTAHPKWAAAQILLVCAVVGGLYGTVLGALLVASENAGTAALVGAVLLGAIGWFVGRGGAPTKFRENRIRSGKAFGGIVGVLGGCTFGSFLGVEVVAFVGAVSGGIAGWLVWRLAGKVKRKAVDPLRGIILGAGVGAVALAWRWDADNATAGALWGAGIGAVCGPVLALALIGTFSFLARPARGV